MLMNIIHVYYGLIVPLYYKLVVLKYSNVSVKILYFTTFLKIGQKKMEIHIM